MKKLPRSINIKPLDNLHNFVVKKSKYHKKWHDFRHSSKIHFGTLIIFTAIVALLGAYYLVPQEPRKGEAVTSVVNPNFPRLGMWQADPDVSPLSEVARYDWIAMDPLRADHIASIRALNPKQIILTAGNAQEVNYNEDLGYNYYWNVEFRSASPKWMLTQAGSTLSAAITKTDTIIPVSNVSRFSVGKGVLVEDELVVVSAVGSSTITVKPRGTVTPAVSHAAGVRIAQVVSNWPRSVNMDLTANCPGVDVGSGITETWADWNIRRINSRINAADWDGILIDRYDGYPSWWGQTIDQNRDNNADTLSNGTPEQPGSLNYAISTGVVSFGQKLRTVVGVDPIISTNGSWRTDVLNGSVHEAFPTPTNPLNTWNYNMINFNHQFRTSYLHSLTNSTKPVFEYLETKGIQTDYKHMRFGLTSALIGDGYFGFVESGGHGDDGLWNYDEYDNAGAGRGYLGQPLGAATQPITNVWRRDYQNGISIVNPSDVAVTVPLGGTYKKINGTQDRTVNDGSTVTQVTIQPKDGIILLKEQTTTCVIGNGDINKDTHVNLSDFSMLMSKWGQTVTNDPADINCSGKIDLSDFSMLMSKWGT